MKKSSYLFSLLFVLSFHLNAQDCDKAVLSKMAGKWRACPAGYIQNVTPAELAKEKAVMTAIQKMITTKYTPTGCVVDYCFAYGKNLYAGKDWKADPYESKLFILPYLCDPASADKSKYYVSISTPTNVSITANVIYSLNNLYAAGIADDEVRAFLRLAKRPVKRDGYYYMSEEVIPDNRSTNKITEDQWLITYNDTLPFSYLSRKEYLLIQKKSLEKKIIEIPSEKVYYETFISNINEYLKKPESELKEVAVCMWNDEDRFEKFVPEGTKGSFIAVVPNPAYYHPKLPKSSPQFFTVVYTVSNYDPVFEDNIANIKKVLDFDALRSMLEK